jgi:hypothetical protein
MPAPLFAFFEAIADELLAVPSKPMADRTPIEGEVVPLHFFDRPLGGGETLGGAGAHRNRGQVEVEFADAGAGATVEGGPPTRRLRRGKCGLL